MTLQAIQDSWKCKHERLEREGGVTFKRCQATERPAKPAPSTAYLQIPSSVWMTLLPNTVITTRDIYRVNERWVGWKNKNNSKPERRRLWRRRTDCGADVGIPLRWVLRFCVGKDAISFWGELQHPLLLEALPQRHIHHLLSSQPHVFYDIVDPFPHLFSSVGPRKAFSARFLHTQLVESGSSPGFKPIIAFSYGWCKSPGI